MLTEKLTNSWTRFCITGENPRAAFCYVMAVYSAYGFPKTEMLAKIAAAAPEVIQGITDDDMLSAFHLLVSRLHKIGRASCRERVYVLV